MALTAAWNPSVPIIRRGGQSSPLPVALNTFTEGTFLVGLAPQFKRSHRHGLFSDTGQLGGRGRININLESKSGAEARARGEGANGKQLAGGEGTEFRNDRGWLQRGGWEEQADGDQLLLLSPEIFGLCPGRPHTLSGRLGASSLLHPDPLSRSSETKEQRRTPIHQLDAFLPSPAPTAWLLLPRKGLEEDARETALPTLP